MIKLLGMLVAAAYVSAARIVNADAERTIARMDHELASMRWRNERLEAENLTLRQEVANMRMVHGVIDAVQRKEIAAARKWARS